MVAVPGTITSPLWFSPQQSISTQYLPASQYFLTTLPLQKQVSPSMQNFRISERDFQRNASSPIQFVRTMARQASRCSRRQSAARSRPYHIRRLESWVIRNDMMRISLFVDAHQPFREMDIAVAADIPRFFFGQGKRSAHHRRQFIPSFTSSQ